MNIDLNRAEAELLVELLEADETGGRLGEYLAAHLREKFGMALRPLTIPQHRDPGHE